MIKSFTLQDVIDLYKSGDRQTTPAKFREILKKDPNNWVALFFMSSLMTDIGDNAMAIQLLYRAAQEKPDEAAVWSNLGTLLRRENHFEIALEALKKAESIDPTNADTLNNLGTLYINEGTAEEGIGYLERAIESDPNHMQARWNLGLLQLEMCRWGEGFDNYFWGLDGVDRRARWRLWPHYNPETDKDRTVLVYGEQGIGDEIMFASILPDLIQSSGHVVFECHPRLQGLFGRMLGDDVTLVPTRKDAVVSWPLEKDIWFDSKISISDLGRWFRRSDEDFPGKAYLRPDPKLTRKMIDRLQSIGSGPHIGIGWRGGYKKTRADLRSMSLDEMLPIVRSIEACGGIAVSLQYDEHAATEVAQFNKKHSTNIVHWDDVVRATDYDQTAALVYALDLLVTINTSVVHLAGAMGKEVWTLTPKGHAWRYASPYGHMIWYDSAKIIKNPYNNWKDIVSQTAGEITARFKHEEAL